MINIRNKINEKPYIEFYDLYEKAIFQKQSNIEAICISSFDAELCEVQARYVNLKIIDGDKWTFFTNYNSPKAQSFEKHKQITALFFWRKINCQIRIKANIFKSDAEFCNIYFASRDSKKNAIAISSDQSKSINSYDEVIKKYEDTLKNENNLNVRPDYWGGYTFEPYYFEFWEGHPSRINRRHKFENKENHWHESYLQP